MCNYPLPYSPLVKQLREEFAGKEFVVVVLGWTKAQINVIKTEPNGAKVAVDVTAKFAPLFTDEKNKFENGYLVGDIIGGAIAHRYDFFHEKRAYFIYM